MPATDSPTLTEETVAILPFGIVIDHPRNCDCVIQSIPGCKLRSTIRADRTVTDAKTGRKRIPADQANNLGRFPTLPGQELHVAPMKCVYRIIDPLCDKPDLLEELRKGLAENTPFRVEQTLKGVPQIESTLDIHRMKTLVREMLRMVEAEEARVIKGEMPKIEIIDKMPGNYLLNPGSMVHNGQPRFEKDWDEFCNNLTLHAG